ncbi:hypothetical protein KUTeg_017420 [Tegillarca granosa]|uniref:Uncharacterized protein n=1 Tax=Tegillarca granosa TaxID=220873 RepID=A0ABQ9EIC5_TEGGR|nr:hypothetical protein KUTeg_017420 [Tegillarca granosa]
MHCVLNVLEKDIATKMSGMYLTQSPRCLPDYMRPKREGTFTYGYGNRISPMRTTPGLYAQSCLPYTHNSLPEDLVIQGMTKRLQNADQIPGGLYRSNTDLARPLNRRVINYPRSEEYVHQHSMFWSTQPLVRGHFIIHPDWVSERITKRKLNTAYGRKKSGLRYGTN